MVSAIASHSERLGSVARPIYLAAEPDGLTPERRAVELALTSASRLDTDDRPVTPAIDYPYPARGKLFPDRRGLPD